MKANNCSDDSSGKVALPNDSQIRICENQLGRADGHTSDYIHLYSLARFFVGMLF